MSTTEENIRAYSTPASVMAYSSDYLRSGERDVIDKYMNRGTRVLDLGCGTGRTTYYIYKNGASVTGVDPAISLIKKGGELHPELELVVGDARKLDFPDDYFDTVFFSFNGLDNLYPIEERLSTLREMWRVMKKNGHLVYSSHNSLALPRTFTGLKFFLDNIFRLRLGLHWRREVHSFGTLLLYYNNPKSERILTESQDFKFVEMVGGMYDKFPLYVFKK